MSSLRRLHACQGPKDDAEEEKVIPWAEGNGLWHTVGSLASDLPAVDIITFFVQNPFTCDTAHNLAFRIGYRPEQVQPILQALADAELLKMTDMGTLRIYQLGDDPHKRQTLQQYVSWLREGFHWARLAMDV